MSYTLVSYETPLGRVPFDEWLDDLRIGDRKGAALVDARLTRLRLGHFGTHRFLGDGVWELKIPFGPGYRVYYVLHEPLLVVLLHGGDKSSQRRDIVKAKAYANDFRRRL